MRDPRDVNPYDLSSVKDCFSRKNEEQKQKYIDDRIKRLNFANGSDGLHPYDLGYAADRSRIYRNAKRLFG